MDYTVYYDQGVGDFIQLEAGVSTKAYTTSVTLIADKIYSFKVTARNTVGSSAQSQQLSIRAAQTPDTPINL